MRFYNVLSKNKCEIAQRFTKTDIINLRLLPYILEFNLPRRERIYKYFNRSVDYLLRLLQIQIPITTENFQDYLNQIYYPNGKIEEENVGFSQALKSVRKTKEIENYIEINDNDFTKSFMINNVEHSLSPKTLLFPILKSVMKQRTESLFYLISKDGKICLTKKEDEKGTVLHSFNESNGNFSIYEIHQFLTTFLHGMDCYTDIVRIVDDRLGKYIHKTFEKVLTESKDRESIVADFKSKIVSDLSSAITIESKDVNLHDKNTLKQLKDVEILENFNKILSFGNYSKSPPFEYDIPLEKLKKFLNFLKSSSIGIYLVSSVDGVYIYKQVNGPSFITNPIKTGVNVYSTTRQKFDNLMEPLFGNFYCSKMSPEKLKEEYISKL
jgi:hypothetical protein